jgi:hypothetical protein
MIGRRTDLWRIGIARRPLDAILREGGIGDGPVTWLAVPRGLRFDADPFGVWHDDRLHLFVEAYDYRDRRGRIDVLTLNRRLNLISRETALSEPWHLSYPHLIRTVDGFHMLPEAHRSGRLTLYRADAFPLGWRPVATIALDVVPVDATPVFFEERWWLFYAPATPKGAAIEQLHVAYADRLTGLWSPHPANPVRRARDSSRPGGTPRVIDGRLVLPVQDCTRTYGGAIRPLFIETLTPEVFAAEAGPPIRPPRSAAGYRDGLHTLSACGDVTLIDVKRVERSVRRRLLDLRALSRRVVSGAPARRELGETA